MGYTQKRFCQEQPCQENIIVFVNEVTAFVDKGGTVNIAP